MMTWRYELDGQAKDVEADPNPQLRDGKGKGGYVDGQWHDDVSSAGYRYVPRMVAGTFQGQHYDGVMTGIAGNHVACVPEARVRSAMVGDQAPRTISFKMPGLGYPPVRY